MKNIIFSLILLTASAPAFAAERTCEDWKKRLPKMADDIRSSSDPAATTKDLALVCGKTIGSAFVSTIKTHGVNTIVFHLTAKLGISAAVTSLVMVTGGHVYSAYQASQLFLAALEKDEKCFFNHELKRAMIEPVAHFYPETHVSTMVSNLSCGEIGRQVLTKVRYVENDIQQKRWKQAEFEGYSRGRNWTAEQVERRFPLAARTLTPEQEIFVEKRARMERPVPLLTAAAELLPCLKPQATARLACDLVAEVAQSYLEPKGHKSMNPELMKVLIEDAEAALKH